MDIAAISKAGIGETVWDNTSRQAVKGLHLRVSKAGQKSFMFYYRSRLGDQRRPKIGTFPEITLAEARARAKVLLLKVAAGEDPQGEWNTKKKEMTVGELFDRVLKGHWDSPRFIKSGYKQDVELYWKNQLKKTFQHKRLSEVDAKMIRSWHTKLSQTPTAANRALEILSKMFSYAIDTEITDRANPCSLVKAHYERKRTRYATKGELIQILNILAREAPKHPLQSAFLLMLIYTGSRPSAISRARWDSLRVFESADGQYGVLSVDGKTTADTGEQETVIFPPQVMSVINLLPRTKPTIVGIKVPTKFWAEVRKEAGCEDLWARDLRRTFATFALSEGINLGTIGELLNHKSTQTTKRYALLTDDSRRLAAMKTASVVSGLLDTKEKDVTPTSN